MIEDPTNSKDDLKYIRLPDSVHERLVFMADEFGYIRTGRTSIMSLFDALSQIPPESLEEILRDEKLLPRDLSDTIYDN